MIWTYNDVLVYQLLAWWARRVYTMNPKSEFTSGFLWRHHLRLNAIVNGGQYEITHYDAVDILQYVFSVPGQYFRAESSGWDVDMTRLMLVFIVIAWCHSSSCSSGLIPCSVSTLSLVPVYVISVLDISEVWFLKDSGSKGKSRLHYFSVKGLISPLL